MTSIFNMKQQAIIQCISKLMQVQFREIRPIQGGDTSAAFLLRGRKQDYFLKINADRHAQQMFEAEKRGLQLIKDSKCIATPKVLACQAVEQCAFILLEYIANRPASSSDFSLLGEQLAKLHLQKQNRFGEKESNWIGQLPQSNQTHSDWPQFYALERLLPQLTLSVNRGYLNYTEIPKEVQLVATLDNFIGRQAASLIHGDLWSGNYLINAHDNKAYLIDPAAYCGHHLVDIAMTRLFGGFDNSFYESYAHYFPKEANYNACMDLYQLYYLLVHLNMFGQSYYDRVSKILGHYWA